MATERLDYDEAFAAIAPLAGHRVRLTYPNGAQRVGLVDVFQPPMPIGAKPDAKPMEPWIRFDGCPVGGELAGCIRIETMGDNGRYS